MVACEPIWTERRAQRSEYITLASRVLTRASLAAQRLGGIDTRRSQGWDVCACRRDREQEQRDAREQWRIVDVALERELAEQLHAVFRPQEADGRPRERDH